MKWFLFDQARGYRQKRPAMYKPVLVCVAPQSEGARATLAVGYRKNAAGDKSCPYFVVPGHGGTVLAWSDCLPETDSMKLFGFAEKLSAEFKANDPRA